ncbi:hypothetical protein A0J61_11375, partial [Choanephora cucurbitarum]
PLSAENDNQARYAQLYIFDPEYAVSTRAANNEDLDNELIQGLSTELHQCNPYWPTANEVAAILPNESSSDSFRVIRIYLRHSEGEFSFFTISQTHALYMPLHYTLLFLMGDLGWNWGLRLDDWIKTQKSNISANFYNGVQDALISEDVDATSFGKRFILPSSYTGGARSMAMQYQDSMAIVPYFGKPSLFITFTANPRWIETQRELLPGQNTSGRPDLVARVFDLKVKELLKDLKVKNVFGTYKGLVRTIEYQKRGLPHLHLLLFLDSSHAIYSADEIDRIISAEIPLKESDPELCEIVTKNMVHGPCGNLNPKSPCMVKDANGNLKCSKRFPKTFTEQTVISDDGNGSIVIDDKWIVPYNPYLSKKFKAHINVECCQSIKAIKYINKYVYKGFDRTTLKLKLSDTENEIERHLQGRYIGPMEAFARIF